MSAIYFKQKGDFSKTKKFLNRLLNKNYRNIIAKYGNEGINALERYTPKEDGTTSQSWYYEIEEDKSGISLIFKNSNVNKGFNVAISLQYGHGTRNGGYVTGIDYINPALRPVFDRLSYELWEEVRIK